MDRFVVALSGDFRKADGTPTFPSFDLNPLKNDPKIEMRWVDAVNNIMPAKGLEGCDALILLAHRMARESFPSDGRLAAIARFGVGYDNVDLAACNDNGVAAIITPDGVRRPVAVSVITFILALSQKLLIKDRLTRQGPPGWAKRVDFMGEGLIGKTLGQLGMGNIGAEVFRMAAPFGMKFIAHDPYIDKAKAAELGVEVVSSDELFRRADFLSVSVPLSDATRHYVNAARLKLMKPTAYLINTARGPIVDQKALYQALTDGTIAGGGLDVFDVEPAPAEEPIYKLDNVIITPHSLCWTDECFAGNGAADIVAVTEVMHGRVSKGIVNKEVIENAAWKRKLSDFRGRFG